MRTLFASTNQTLTEQIRAVWADGNVERCGGGRAALAALDEGGYDAVVTDLRLPDTNAIDLVRRIRARGLSLPVVVVGDDQARLRHPALDAGADDYLVRSPTLARTVSAAVRAALQRRQLGVIEAPVTWVPARAHVVATLADTPMTASPAVDALPAARGSRLVQGVPWMKELAGLTRKAAQADLAAQVFAELETILTPAAGDDDPLRTLEHARELVSGVGALRRRVVTVPGGVVFDDEIVRMSPVLTGLTQGLVAVRVALHAERAAVLLSTEEILRVVTLLVMSCREALPAGGTVSIETQPTEMAPPLGRASTPIPAVSVEVTRVGLAAMPVVVPSTLAMLVSSCAFRSEPVTLAGSVVGVRLLLPIDGDER